MDLSPIQKAVWRHYYKGAKKELRKNGGMLLNTYDHYLPGKSSHSGNPPLVWRGTKKPEIEQLHDKGKFASSWAIGSKKRTFVASSPRKAWLYAKEKPESRIYGMTPSVLKRTDAKVADQVGATSTNAPLRRGILKNEVRVLLKPKEGSYDLHPQWRPTPLGEIQRKEFAGLLPDGYHLPYVAYHHDSKKIAGYVDPSRLKEGISTEGDYFKEGKSHVGVEKLKQGGRITLPSPGLRPDAKSPLGKLASSYDISNGGLRPDLERVDRGAFRSARQALRKHEVVHSILQQRRGSAPSTVAQLAKEEAIASSKQFFGPKSPAKHLPLGRRIQKFLTGTAISTIRGKRNLGISRWFGISPELTSRLKGMKQFEKPFLRYSPKRHARTGGLNDSFREKYNREHGSHLQRPVTKKPSELKPGSKAAKRRESFCARMSGVSGPTSKDGKLTPKGAALKRWNCSAIVRGIKHFSQTPEEERHELLKTGILSTGLAGGLALGGAALRGSVGAAERAAIARRAVNRVVAARRNASAARTAVEATKATESAKLAKAAAKARYRAGNASFSKLAKNPNLTKGEKEAVRRTQAHWKQANPNKEFSEGDQRRDTLSRLRDAASLGAGLGVIGLTGYTGYRVHGIAKQISKEVPGVARVVKSELPGLSAYGKATLRKISKAATGVQKTADTVRRGPIGEGAPGWLKKNLSSRLRSMKTLSSDDQPRRHSIALPLLAGAAGGALLASTPRAIAGIRRVERVAKQSARKVGGLAESAGKMQENLKHSTSAYADIGRIYSEAKGGAYNLLHPINTLRETKAAFRAGLQGKTHYPTRQRPAWALAARLRGLKKFALKTEEDGIPYTGRVNRDRFVKQIHEGDLDRRDRNIDHAVLAGGAAGLLTAGSGSPLKARLIRAGIGAGAGLGGVLAIRAATDGHRDIYGDRPRWAKRAEAVPTIAGIGTVGALVAKKAKLFASGPFGTRVHSLMGGKLELLRGPGAQRAVKSKLATQPIMQKSVDLIHRGMPAGTKRVRVEQEMLRRVVPEDRFIGGTISYRNGKKTAHVDADLVRSSGKQSVRNVAHHEVFHTVPVVGHSEVIAHAWGGLHDRKVRGVADLLHNARAAARDVGHLASGRPGRTAMEIGAAGTLGVSGSMIHDSLKNRRTEDRKEFSLHPDEQHSGNRQAVKAGISGALSGALLGGGATLMKRGTSIADGLRAARNWGAGMGAVAGGGAWIGNKVMGDPNPSDKTAYTKRAAVGGALAGAALGGAGAIALKKGLLGPAIAAKLETGAKSIRPLNWIKNASTPAAAAIGAGALGAYGAHQGLDEGMMVDAINNSQGNDPKKQLSARLRRGLKLFGYSSQLREKDTQRYVSPTRAALGLHGDVVDASGAPAAMTGAQTIGAFYRKGKEIHRAGGRVSGLLRDTGDVLAGRPRRTDGAGRPQRREWEKSWFHRAVGGAATGGALLGGALLTSKTKFGQQHILPHLRRADNAARSVGVSLFSSKIRRSLKQFDLDASLAGWDVRDPRGRSARVFAPGSRPRFRREKEWHEKKENREALLKGAIIGTGLLGGAAGIAATRKVAGLPVIPKIAKAAKKTYPVLQPGEKLGKFGNFVPSQHRGTNIVEGIFPKKSGGSAA